MKATHESAVISYSDKSSIDARMKIFNSMNEYEATDDEKERSMGLFLRGSLLARIFAISDIYKQILNVPGVIFDVGTWRGQTAVICENLRAIFEPLHLNRRIVCFDTFEGYKGFSVKDKQTNLHCEGTYSVGGEAYAQFLRDLLVLHEKSNALGHNNGKHKVIVGDATKTIPQFFVDNPNECVSLAFFDLNVYDPAAHAFENIWPRLVPGGIIAFWQLTRDVIPAEGRFYAEKVLEKYPHKIQRCSTYPGLCYIQKI